MLNLLWSSSVILNHFFLRTPKLKQNPLCESPSNFLNKSKEGNGLMDRFGNRWSSSLFCSTQEKVLYYAKTALYRNSLQKGWPTFFTKGPKSSTKTPRGPTSLSKPSWRAKIQQNITFFQLVKRKIITINVSYCLHGPLKKSLRAKNGPRASPWPSLAYKFVSILKY